MFRTTRVWTLLLAITAVAACEIPSRADLTGDEPTRVDVSPKNVIVQQYQAVDFTAIGLTSAGDTADVTINWTATSGAITDTSTSNGRHRGRYRAGSDTGRAKIVAHGNRGTADTAVVTITEAPVTTVAVSPAAASIAVGATVQLSATMQDLDGNPLPGRVVTWASTNPGVATVSSIGLVRGVAAGAATVTASSEGQTGAAAITVAVVPVASVAVSPPSASVAAGQTVQLTATPKDANGNALSGRTVTWATSNAAVATVSGTGLVSGVAVGSATLTATSEGRSGTATMTVSAVPVSSVTVTPASASVVAGQTVQLSATPKDANGNPLTGRVVTWATSSAAVATVNGSGLVTGVAAGTATLTATSEGNSGTATVTVSAVPVNTVTVSPASASVVAGQTVQLTATPKDANGNPLTGRVVTWATSSAAVATVNGSGLVTGVAAGSATITATSEGKSGTATVTVTLPVASVTVSPLTASVVVGQTVQLTATPKDANGNPLTGRVVTWASNAPAVATVSVSGLVTGVAAGSATITATSEGKSGTATVTVSPAATRAGWYVAANGLSSGDGSSGRPWNLQTAMNGAGGRVHPGDTIWLRGGTYTATGAINTTLSGTAAAPIIVRQYPGERAVLDAKGATSSSTRGDFFIVSGSYVTFWGFELMDSDLNRSTDTRPNMIVVSASHVKFINLLVHDGGIGFYTFPEQTDIEIYGCLIYYNGWQQPDFGNGHGVYLKSNAGPLYLRDNILFNQFGYGIHVYSNAGDGLLNNIYVEGNVSFNNGAIDTDPVNSPSSNLLYGGGDPATGGRIVDNMMYFSPNVGEHNVVIGYSSTANISLTAQNNYAVGGQTVFEVGSWQSLTMSGNSAFGATSNPVNLRNAATAGFQLGSNRYYRDPAARAWRYSGTLYTFSGWQQAAGVGATDQAQAANPTQPQVFVRPSRYEVGRGNVIIYNWGRQASVPVDLSGVLQVGARYEIRSAQNFFATPVGSGTYGGGTVSIPMSGVTPAQVVGGSPTAPPRTGPDFDVFVVITTP